MLAQAAKNEKRYRAKAFLKKWASLRESTAGNSLSGRLPDSGKKTLRPSRLRGSAYVFLSNLNPYDHQQQKIGGEGWRQERSC